MSTVYLLVVSYVDDHHPIHEPSIAVRTRAFVSTEVRATAARRFIDELRARFDIAQVPEDFRRDVQDVLDDMAHARAADDLSYELTCCRDAFGLDVVFQEAAIELEELLGEIIK